MKKLLKGTLTGLLLVTLVTPGFAENRKGAVTLSPFVGGYILDKKLPFESRPIFGLAAGYNFTENLSAEAMFGYSLTETKLSGGSAASKEVDLTRYGVDILYHFMPQKALVPFVEVGGGITHYKIPNTPSMSAEYYIGQVNYGLGLKYFIAPDVALRADARHAILVQDAAHNSMEYSVGLTFQFGGERKAVAAIESTEVADNIAPTVTFVAPVKGATGINVNQKASVAFSEDMDGATLSDRTFTMKQGTTPVTGTVTSTASTASFTPTHYYEKDKEYTATVTTGVKDLSGNAMANDYQWAFTTGSAADTTAPTVTFTSPTKGATAAPVKQKVNVAFSENMDPASINAGTFSVKQGNTPVDGRITSSASTATFSPARDLEKGKSYTAVVTTGTRDLAGNALANNYQWDFTAYAAPKVVGVLVTLENSHFDFNSAVISENGKTILNHNAKALKANPAMKLRIAGYTSASGSVEYNQDLSERRADAVKEYLVTSGVDANRLTTVGHGKSNPAKFEANPADKLSAEAYANMRVVLEIIED